jgi:hypothetical protein
VLVFSVIMIVSFIQVGVEAVERLLEGEQKREMVVLSLQSIIIMASTGMSPGAEARSNCSGREVRVLALVTVHQEFGSSGIGARCYE